MALEPHRLDAYPQTGLAQLGDALLRGSSDYANIQLRERHDAERRAQQLADLANARDYSEKQFDKIRGLTLEDERRHRSQRVDDETYKLLLDEGWLKPDEANDPVAIAAAADNRQKHIDSLRTGEVEALANAQKELNELAQDRDKLVAKDLEADNRLREIQSDIETTLADSEVIPPTEEMKRREAMRLAQAAGVTLAAKEPARSKQLGEYLLEAERRLNTAAFVKADAAQKKLKSLERTYSTAVREKNATTSQLQVARQSIAGPRRQFRRPAVRTDKRGPAEVLSVEAAPGEDLSYLGFEAPAGTEPSGAGGVSGELVPAPEAALLGAALRPDAAPPPP